MLDRVWEADKTKDSTYEIHHLLSSPFRALSPGILNCSNVEQKVGTQRLSGEHVHPFIQSGGKSQSTEREVDVQNKTKRTCIPEEEQDGCPLLGTKFSLCPKVHAQPGEIPPCP